MLAYFDGVCSGRQRGCGEERPEGPEGRAGSSWPGPALSCGMTHIHTPTNTHTLTQSDGHLLSSSLFHIFLAFLPDYNWLLLAGMCWNQSCVWGGRPFFPSTLSPQPRSPLSCGTVSFRPFSFCHIAIWCTNTTSVSWLYFHLSHSANCVLSSTVFYYGWIKLIGPTKLVPVHTVIHKCTTAFQGYMRCRWSFSWLNKQLVENSTLQETEVWICILKESRGVCGHLRVCLLILCWRFLCRVRMGCPYQAAGTRWVSSTSSLFCC